MADRLRTTLWLALAQAGSASGLNLATRPGGGHRAFSALACGAALALLAVSISLIVSFARTERSPEQLLGQQQGLLAEQRSLADAGAAATRQLQSESSAEILERTAFLNELLVRKGVSWTRTFADLEAVLPPSVRTLAIQPEVARGDTIRLEMTVGARRPADFIEFLKALEGSDLFRAPAVRGSVPPGDGDPTFRYRLTVEYDQQL